MTIFVVGRRWECPLWVKSGRLRRKTTCPLCPRMQTLRKPVGSIIKPIFLGLEPCLSEVRFAPES